MVICVFLELSRTFAWRHIKNASIVSFVIVGYILSSVYQEIELLTRLLFNPHKALREITFSLLFFFSIIISDMGEKLLPSVIYFTLRSIVFQIRIMVNGICRIIYQTPQRNLFFEWIIIYVAFDKHNLSATD